MINPAHLWIKDITEEANVNGCYLAKEKSVGTTRRGEPFLTLTLADRTGEVEAKVWDNAEEISERFQQGDILEVDGKAGSYRGRIQLRVSSIKVRDGNVDPGIFMESAPGNISEMLGALRKILKAIEDNHLKALVDAFLRDQEFISLFKQAPAAKNFHHGYIGGLLEHTLSVCRLASQIAAHYPQLNKDLLLAAAFLHDVGKVREFKFDLGIDYSDEGRLLGHLVLGAALVDEKLSELKDFPDALAIRLKHLILSHHGEYAFGSPKRPKFLEAFALHLIDDLDAKINGLARFMERDRKEGSWTDFNRLFERYFLKGPILSEQEPPGVQNNQPSDQQQTLFSS